MKSLLWLIMLTISQLRPAVSQQSQFQNQYNQMMQQLQMIMQQSQYEFQASGSGPIDVFPPDGNQNQLCDALNCQNGAFCNNQFGCLCPTGYTGQDCSALDLDSSLQLPCYNIKPGRGIELLSSLTCAENECKTLSSCTEKCESASNCVGFTVLFDRSLMFHRGQQDVTRWCGFHGSSQLADNQRHIGSYYLNYFYYEKSQGQGNQQFDRFQRLPNARCRTLTSASSSAILPFLGQGATVANCYSTCIARTDCNAFQWTDQNDSPCQLYLNTDCQSTASGPCGTTLYRRKPEWSEWSACSQTCGTATQSRTRQCVDSSEPNCNAGVVSESRPCQNNPPCSTTQWGSWTAWTSCSVSCGRGYRMRTRRCMDFSLCQRPIEIDGGWSQWGPWSPCNVDCSAQQPILYGLQRRERQCDNPEPQGGGRDCFGERAQEKPCINLECLPGYGPWAAWTACSTTCGPGFTSRERVCQNAPFQGECSGYSRQEQPCNQGPCTSLAIDGGWSEWTEWSGCTVTCGSTDQTRMRTRRCDNPAPVNGGRQCYGSAEEQTSCPMIACPTTDPNQVPGYNRFSSGDCKRRSFRFCSTTYCPTPLRCGQACQRLNGCKGFRFHEPGKFCHLLYDRCEDWQVAASSTSSAFVYYRRNQQSSGPPALPQLVNPTEVTNFTSRHGDCPAIPGLTAGQRTYQRTITDCADQCQRLTGVDECYGFTFDYASYQCLLYKQSCSDMDLQIGSATKIHYTRHTFSWKGCGYPAIEFQSNRARIVGGRVAKPHSHPWMVSLRTAGGRHFCGGSVVDPSWILTATHCLEDYSSSNPPIKIVAGRFNVDHSEPSEQIRDVQRIFQHPRYNRPSNSLNNDISLLRLAAPLNYDAFVSPICVPGHEVPEGAMCYATGWGDTRGTNPYETLNEVSLTVIGGQHCSRVRETSNQFCAGHLAGGRDTCQGDSGGPLICQTSAGGRAFHQHGIVSYGFDCAQPNYPGVYTKVKQYYSWIMQTIEQNRQ